MLEEFWVVLNGFPNYAVSNYGRVTNARRNRDLTPSADKNGYLRVALYDKGLRTDVYVHRLVARAFFLNYRDDIEVKHINGHLDDNTVLNLTLGVRKCRTGAPS